MAWRQCEYPHQQDMPFAREPLKSIYVAQRLFTTLVLVPIWALYYAIMPRSHRPRPSWSIKQIIAVKFTRRIYKVTEFAGVTWGTRNPYEACDNRELKETRFEWADPLSKELRSGILLDEQVPFKRVGMFVWPRVKPSYKIPGDPSGSNKRQESEDTEAGRVPTIGIFLHGGGYCHMSAHEGAKTSKIPRRLMKDQAFDEIYAVEYRLLQHAPFPAAVQDAAAVYAHVLSRHHDPQERTDSRTMASNDKSSRGHNDSQLSLGYNGQQLERTTENGISTPRKHHKVVLIGDSAGGNLVLALARWIRDEALLPPPDGILLLSPSCDPSHAFPDSPSLYVPRPHGDTDYLVDTPEPRALLQRTFLGHNSVDTMHSPYVSPASHKVLRAYYGELFVANVEDLTIHTLDDDVLHSLRTMATAPPTPNPGLPTPMTPGTELTPASLVNPVMASPRGLSLFSEFPKTCIVLGDAERLEREVMKLMGAMERDGVQVRRVWVKDGVHDILMMGWWDEQIRDEVWGKVEGWIREIVIS